ncbi:hypothetical protein [Thermoactinomyces vulgaris]|uniref:hypothetical protein n=1 Tax=Thermoactinomyces vulgaris TaxID=2026 RepID=UPI000A6056D9
MEIQIGCEYVPAEITDLLKGIVGAKVMKLTRFSWWKGSEAKEQLQIEADARMIRLSGN